MVPAACDSSIDNVGGSNLGGIQQWVDTRNENPKPDI